MRHDYSKFNYCFHCSDKGDPYPKSVIQCPKCNQKIRTRTHCAGASARHRARQKRMLSELALKLEIPIIIVKKDKYPIR